MEIIVHTIKDLNRFLNLGIYLLVDSRQIVLLSLTLGKALKEYNSTCTLELYQDLVELKKMLTSWSIHYSKGMENAANMIKGQIHAKYNFDITKHYHPKKYGIY